MPVFPDSFYEGMKNIPKYTSKRLEVHLMVDNPEKYIPLYAELNTEFIIFHVEVESDIKECIDLIKSYSIKAGLAIKPNTPISALVPYLPFIDEILVMRVDPGAGEQSFLDGSKERLEEVRTLLNEYKINAVINVDGGVNDISREYCSVCDIVTSGSYVVKSDDFQARITTLR